MFLFLFLAGAALVAQAEERVEAGLVALYTFEDTDGDTIRDRSNAGEPLDLKIADSDAVRRGKGMLEITGETVIQSSESADKIIDAVKLSGELTVEAWIRPENTSQDGPARIVTMSQNSGARNITFGQDGGNYDIRFRTTETSTNGIPSLPSPDGAVKTEWTHVAYAHDRSGRTRIYINGEQVAETTLEGSTSNWSPGYRLALGNEMSGERLWKGAYRLVAIYARDLLAHEVRRNFEAGPDARPETLAASASTALFERHVARILAKNCLECHDTATKEGKLDLSKKAAAFAGGKEGLAIVPGKPAESLLWDTVDFDDMPKDRDPLKPEEKAILKKWIEEGAAWTVDEIDPAIYEHGGEVATSWLRRLTVPEYIETVRAAVGVDISQEARRILPPDLRADGFSNTAYNLNVDLGHVEAYATLAEMIVDRMDVEAFAIAYADSERLTDPNMRSMVARMGKWLLRGPLDEREINAFRGITTTVASAGGDFEEAAGYVVEAMLQSPRFLYRLEYQVGDGARWPVGEYELASRMSYIVWGGPPDEELLRAVERGELYDRDGVEKQLRRMLGEPRAIERSAHFADEWLHLARLGNLAPNEEKFPDWNGKLAGDMREETLRYFRSIAWEEKRPLSDLMNAQQTYLSPRLAEFYDLPPAKGTEPERGLRADANLLALYTFEEGKGDVVYDRSGAGEALDLRIDDTSATRWGADGLEVREPTMISRSEPPERLFNALRESREMTVVARVTPAGTDQSGPARIVTFSSGISNRNLTLGQDGDQYQMRFRTSETDNNGLPGTDAGGGSVKTKPTEVVFSRAASGNTKIYINGEQTGSAKSSGDMSNWDRDFTLALANETSNNRPWLGTYHRVAIYDCALSPDELREPETSLTRYDLSERPERGGLLTHGSILTIGGDEASMVARGLFVLHDVLNGSVNDPPPCVDTTPVPSKPGLSQRAIAEQRIADASCGGCHSRFEPLAFGLEKFDGLGAYHDKDEHGNELRQDGEILFPGEGEPVPYKTVAELMNLLADSDRVKETLTRKVTQFALGRPIVATDATELKKIHASAWENGGTYESLITAIVMSDLVQTTQTEPRQKETQE